MMLPFIKCTCRVLLPCARSGFNVRVCMRMYVRVDSIRKCYGRVSRMYIMHLDGKVSHVAANIVTVVSVRVHTSGNSSGTSSDKYNGTH